MRHSPSRAVAATCGSGSSATIPARPARIPAGGTRFTYEHTGFTGISGLFMAKLLGHVRTKMLSVGLPALLNDLDT
jgi:hypothetical protein